MKREDFMAQWSSLHNNAPTTGIVGGWLRISYRLARGANRLGMTPNGLTLLGLALSIAAISTPTAALILVPLSLACDGIDGSLALIQQRQSRLGSLYDSVADRIAEGCWVYIFYLLGAPLWAAIAMWTLGATQEYARARITSLGVVELGVITPMERPVRASALFIALVAHQIGWNFSSGVLYVALGLQLISVLLVVRFASQSLQQPSQR